MAAAVLGNPRMAEDVLQEAALTGLQQLPRFRPGTRFEAWMSQIVRFTALNQMRTEHRSPRSLEEQTLVDARPADPGRSGAGAPVGADGELHPDQNCFDDHVLQALRELKEPARACLLLRTVMELEYREIAEILGMAEGTAASHVHRARHRMRTILDGKPDKAAENPRRAS